ncbi:MAG: TerC family protein [Proteobacteria bacterium]|nr:TerC family protein [Pseudomonadota bacterium]
MQPAMIENLFGEAFAGPLAAFLQVLMIDLVLAGDNAVAVGLAAAGLPHDQRRKVILYGLGAAVALRIFFALITVQLLQVGGVLIVAGGLLLLYVCWRMWRDLRAGHGHGEDEAQAEAGLEGTAKVKPAKTFGQAFLTIFIADVSMSLDNVLAVAGAAREHPTVLVIGLVLSIALMGVAATWLARLLHRFPIIGYIGLFIVLFVAGRMIFEGYRDVVVDSGRTEAHNAAMPGLLDISPEEADHLRNGSGEEH